MLRCSAVVHHHHTETLRELELKNISLAMTHRFASLLLLFALLALLALSAQALPLSRPRAPEDGHNSPVDPDYPRRGGPGPTRPAPARARYTRRG